MGEAWNSMSDKDKKVFNDFAATDKARYEKEKVEYESKGDKKKTPAKASEKKKKVFFFIKHL